MCAHTFVYVCSQVRSRQDTRFNSMLQEQYGGRKAIREFLATGVTQNLRLPPCHRNPEGVRRPEPPPRSRPNAEAKRAKYYSRLEEDLRSGSRPSQRSTKLWQEFEHQAREGKGTPYETRRFPKAAAGLSQAAGQQQGGTWEPGISAGSRTPAGQPQGSTWEPGVSAGARGSAGSRPAAGQQRGGTWEGRGRWWESGGWQGGSSSSWRG